jgi:hypothetical protein
MKNCSVCDKELTGGLDTFGLPQAPLCWNHFWKVKQHVVTTFDLARWNASTGQWGRSPTVVVLGLMNNDSDVR